MALKINIPFHDKLTSIALSKYANVQIGEKAYTIGNPLGLKYRITDGIIAQKEDYFGSGKILQFTCPVSPGSSGSPLLNSKGEAIGIVKGAKIDTFAQNVNFAVSTDEITDLLTEDRHLSLSEFAQITKGISLIEEGNKILAEAGFEAASEFYIQIANNPRDDLTFFMASFEMLKISALASEFWTYNTAKLLDEYRNERNGEIPKELQEKGNSSLEEAHRWINRHINFIEAAGGLKFLYGFFIKLGFVSSKDKESLEYMLCSGYVNGAKIALFEPDGKKFSLLFCKSRRSLPSK